MPGFFVGQSPDLSLYGHIAAFQRQIFQLQLLSLDQQRAQSGFQQNAVLVEADYLGDAGDGQCFSLIQGQFVQTSVLCLPLHP